MSASPNHSRSQSRQRTKTESPSARLGRFFREKRIHSGKSLAETANYAKITKNTLETYETGRRSIPLVHIYAISNYLNIPPSDVMAIIGSSGI